MAMIGDEKMNKIKKPIKVIIMIFVSIIMIFLIVWIIKDYSYVMLLDAIQNRQNKKVAMLLKLPFSSLDKTSGHFPVRYFAESEENNSPLETACKYGNYKAAKMLIEKGADASRVQEEHFSLLYLSMESTESDDFNLIKLLVQNGADPDGAPDDDHDGNSSLEHCARMDCGDYYYNNYLPTTGSWEEELKKAEQILNDFGSHILIGNKTETEAHQRRIKATKNLVERFAVAALHLLNETI